MTVNYEFPRPALTVDIAVFALDADDLKVMLIERDLEPFAGCWALPGGFVRVDETLETAARRELLEETGLKDIYCWRSITRGFSKRRSTGCGASCVISRWASSCCRRSFRCAVCSISTRWCSIASSTSATSVRRS
jgi:ADP-ribose pyrophosphatase YjhB (NUDIX family)